ncbi:hypothetical protein BKA93DRAFT_829049 [Sparassis latifolia]
MDNLFAIGVGLALRAVIDSITHHNHRVNGSLVGLWEGAVLHHFLAKFPSSFDPYVAFGFRLFIDLLVTESLTRMTIVILWTGLGMLLSDLGVDMWADKRVRRLWRRIRHASPFYISSSSNKVPTGNSVSRVQFLHIPTNSTVTSNTARSPQSPQDSQASLRSRDPPSPSFRRPSTHPIPGAFSDSSEAVSDVSRQRIVLQQQQLRQEQQRIRQERLQQLQLQRQQQLPPQPSSPQSPQQPPPQLQSPQGPEQLLPREQQQSLPQRQHQQQPLQLPQQQQPLQLPQQQPPFPPQLQSRTPSEELEYIPLIPDTSGDEFPPVRPRASASDASGLTTPNEHGSPKILVHSPRPNYSGLTTPASSPPHVSQEQLPPVTIYGDADSKGQPYMSNPTELSDVPPIPIRLRPVPEEPDTSGEGSTITFPQPDIIDPQPSPAIQPPLAEMPIIPGPEDGEMAAAEPSTALDDADRGPPPSYTQAQADDSPDNVSEKTAAESVISGHSKSIIVAKADELRKQAAEEEVLRARLRRECSEARRNHQYWKAFQLNVEIKEAEENAKQLHAKAARRYYKAHNLNPEPHEVDVHRLHVPEAIEKVEKALYDAMMSGATELRIITGKGIHSQGVNPKGVLRRAIIGAMQE